jgi:hypothetical protein
MKRRVRLPNGMEDWSARHLRNALKEGPATAGAAGEPIYFCWDTMRIMPPSFRKNSFTPLEISASTTKKLKKSDFPIRYYRDHVFSEGGRHHRPDEPIVYPEHLTEELDYELELAVVLMKSESIFLRLFLVQPSTH